MTTLVVQAHPLADSYNAALLDAVVDRHPSATVRRLGEGDQVTTADLDGVTSLIAVYPTWWGSLPAAFLSNLVDVIGPWVDGDEPATTSPLRSVKALTVVTSHGSSKLVNAMQGEPGRHLWKRTVLPLCARGATFTWRSLYGVDRIDATARTAFLNSL